MQYWVNYLIPQICEDSTHLMIQVALITILALVIRGSMVSLDVRQDQCFYPSFTKLNCTFVVNFVKLNTLRRGRARSNQHGIASMTTRDEYSDRTILGCLG